MIARHVEETSSKYASKLLLDWDRAGDDFWQVVPKEYVKYLAMPLTDEVQALRA